MGAAFVVVMAVAFFALLFRRQAAAPTPPAPRRAEPSRADMPEAPADLSWSRGDLERLIRQISAEERFELPEVAIAIARVESSMDPRAVNPLDGGTESLGLFQMKLWLAQHYNPSISDRADMLSPELNARAAVRWLSDLTRRYLPEYGLDGVIQMHSLGETKFRTGTRNPGYLAKVRAELANVAAGR